MGWELQFVYDIVSASFLDILEACYAVITITFYFDLTAFRLRSLKSHTSAR